MSSMAAGVVSSMAAPLLYKFIPRKHPSVGAPGGVQRSLNKKNRCEKNKFIPGKHRGSNRGPHIKMFQSPIVVSCHFICVFARPWTSQMQTADIGLRIYRSWY